MWFARTGRSFGRQAYFHITFIDCLLPTFIYAGDFEYKLNSEDGTTAFEIRDSANAVVSDIDLDGNLTIRGGMK